MILINMVKHCRRTDLFLLAYRHKIKGLPIFGGLVKSGYEARIDANGELFIFTANIIRPQNPGRD